MKNSARLVAAFVLCYCTAIWMLLENIFELQKYKIESKNPSLQSNLGNFNIHLDSLKLTSNDTYASCRNDRIKILILNAKSLFENETMSDELENDCNKLVKINKIHCGISTDYSF